LAAWVTSPKRGPRFPEIAAGNAFALFLTRGTQAIVNIVVVQQLATAREILGALTGSKSQAQLRAQSSDGIGHVLVSGGVARSLTEEALTSTWKPSRDCQGGQPPFSSQQPLRPH